MKRLMIVGMMLCHASLYAQQDSITLSVKYGTEDKELLDVLRFQNIEEYKVTIGGPAAQGKQVDIYYKQYTEGKVTDSGKLTSSMLPASFTQVKDSFTFKLLSQQRDPDSVYVMFALPRFQTQTYLHTKHSMAYSMRMTLLPSGTHRMTIPYSNKKMAMFAFSLPYVKQGDTSGSAFYCALTGEGIPPEQWWDKYGVKHCIVFYLKVG